MKQIEYTKPYVLPSQEWRGYIIYSLGVLVSACACLLQLIFLGRAGTTWHLMSDSGRRAGRLLAKRLAKRVIDPKKWEAFCSSNALLRKATQSKRSLIAMRIAAACVVLIAIALSLLRNTKLLRNVGTMLFWKAVEEVLLLVSPDFFKKYKAFWNHIVIREICMLLDTAWSAFFYLHGILGYGGYVQGAIGYSLWFSYEFTLLVEQNLYIYAEYMQERQPDKRPVALLVAAGFCSALFAEAAIALAILYVIAQHTPWRTTVPHLEEYYISTLLHSMVMCFTVAVALGSFVVQNLLQAREAANELPPTENLLDATLLMPSMTEPCASGTRVVAESVQL